MNTIDIEKHIITCSLIWLYSAIILFLGGWVQPWLAIPIACLLVYCGIRCVSHLLPERSPIPFSSQIIQLLLFACMGFACSFFAGHTGHFPQHILDMAQRNAVYGNLYLQDWPIVLPDGRYLVYYFASFLPAAFASKLAGADLAPVILMLWNALAYFLAFSLLYYHFRKGSTTWLCILALLVIGDPIILLSPISEYISHIFQIPVSLNSQGGPLVSGFICGPNHLPPVELLTVLILNKRIRHDSIPVLAAIAPLFSAFASVGLLPFVVWRYLNTNSPWEFCSRKRIYAAIVIFFSSVEGYTALLIAGISILYYGCANGDLVTTLCFLVTYGKPMWYIILKNVLHVGLIVVILSLPFWIRQQKESGLLWAWLTSILITNLIFIGNGGPNELAFKGSTPFLIITSVWWVKRISTSSMLHKIALGMILFAFSWASFSSIIIPRLATFGKKDTHINNPFNDHLYHPGTLLDQTVVPSKPAVLPHVLYATDGESRQYFPFNLLPPEDEKLYQRPATFRPDNKFLRSKPSNSDLKIKSIF